MTIRDLIRAYVLADATVASLLGTRLYPDLLPEKVTYPAGKLFVVDIVRPGQLHGPASRAVARIQIDVWAAPTSGPGARGTADAIGAAIRQRLAAQNVTLLDDSVSPALPVFAQIGEPEEREGVDPEINGGLSDWSADFLVSYQTHAGVY